MGESFIRNRVRSRMPRFTYTGNYDLIDDEHGNWRLRLLSSGTLTFKTSSGKLNHGIDIFLVGGGGGGANAVFLTDLAVGSGGGGYTKTHKNISVSKGVDYAVTIGAAGNNGGTTGTDGGQSSIKIGNTTYKAAGGIHAHGNPGSFDSRSIGYGGNGGSGGASVDYYSSASTVNGGTDGNNGSGAASHSSGYGQRNVSGPNGESGTTGEFGDSSAKKYGGGGGANNPYSANSGNGGYVYYDGGWKSGAASSGIVILRNHR